MKVKGRAAAAAKEAARLAQFFNSLDTEFQLDIEPCSPVAAPVVVRVKNEGHDVDATDPDDIPLHLLSLDSSLTSSDEGTMKKIMLTDIPEDLLGWIFSFIPMTSLVGGARAVCHSWYMMVNAVIDTYDVLETFNEQNSNGEIDDQDWSPETPRLPIEDSLASLLQGHTPRRTPRWSPIIGDTSNEQTVIAVADVNPAPPLRLFTRRSKKSELKATEKLIADFHCSGHSMNTKQRGTCIDRSRNSMRQRSKNQPCSKREAFITSPQSMKAFMAFCAAQADLQSIDSIELFSPTSAPTS